MNSLQWLQQWYYAHCDDTWEHQHGITIQSLDNPGWLIKIDLAGTPLSGVDIQWHRKNTPRCVARLPEPHRTGVSEIMRIFEIIDKLHAESRAGARRHGDVRLRLS
jgi:hypothetical protein